MRQKDRHAEMMLELERLQQDLSCTWLDQSLPKDWNGMDADYQIRPETTRVTLRLDADMVRWFRKLGPGYQERINRVLRVYYCALLGGVIHGYPQDNPLRRIKLDASLLLERIEERRRAREGG